MEEKEYISNQISKFMNNRKLVETLSFLNVAPVSKFAKLHSKSDEIDGKKTYSYIKLNIQDYSFGKGDRMKKVSFNLLPSEIAYLFDNVAKGTKSFNFEREKLYENEIETKILKLFVKRKEDTKWKIQIENGVGVAKKTVTGSKYCEPTTYEIKNKVDIELLEEEIYILFYETLKYINLWEMTYCQRLILAGGEKMMLNINGE